MIFVLLFGFILKGCFCSCVGWCWSMFGVGILIVVCGVFWILVGRVIVIGCKVILVMVCC